MENFGLGREGRTVVIAPVLKITTYLRYRQLSVGSTTVGALYKRRRHHRDSTSNTRLRVYAHTYETIKRNMREREREGKCSGSSGCTLNRCDEKLAEKRSNS